MNTETVEDEGYTPTELVPRIIAQIEEHFKNLSVDERVTLSRQLLNTLFFFPAKQSAVTEIFRLQSGDFPLPEKSRMKGVGLVKIAFATNIAADDPACKAKLVEHLQKYLPPEPETMAATINHLCEHHGYARSCKQPQGVNPGFAGVCLKLPSRQRPHLCLILGTYFKGLGHRVVKNEEDWQEGRLITVGPGESGEWIYFLNMTGLVMIIFAAESRVSLLEPYRQ